MVAANAGEDNARVVAATTAACAKANEKYTVHTYASVSFFCARGARGARGRGRARGVASASPAGYRAWGEFFTRARLFRRRPRSTRARARGVNMYIYRA